MLSILPNSLGIKNSLLVPVSLTSLGFTTPLYGRRTFSNAGIMKSIQPYNPGKNCGSKRSNLPLVA